MRGRPQWAVKDPLSLRFFQLREEEYFVLQMLDGRTSIDEIQARFERRFAPRRLEPRRLQAFLGRLHEDGLILSDLPDQGTELRLRRGRLVRKDWIETLTNLLALRFRGVDPSRFLRWLAPLCGWMFSRWVAAIYALFVMAAILLVTVHFETLLARLPEFRALFRADNLLWLALAVGTAKVLHELGHALACQRFGGRCHELGLMLLVFTPCLYCNVSDAWMLPDKWRRIAISAAGIIVEIGLASLAVFVWWWSGPGLLNGLAMNLMVVCSISTLAFNGNPLLRYDGYYILADLVEVPNLQQQAGAVVRRWLAHWLLGVELPDDRLLPERGHGWLALYAIASLVYRFVVVGVVIWCMHRALAPYGLDVLVEILGLVTVGGMIGVPAVRAARWMHRENRREQVSWGRLIVRGGLVMLGIVALLSIPLPYHINAPVALEPAGARSVYVTIPGRLVESVEAGAVVHAGDALARLENREVELEVTRLEGDVKRQADHLRNLESQQGTDPRGGGPNPDGPRIAGRSATAASPAARRRRAIAARRSARWNRPAAAASIAGTAPRPIAHLVRHAARPAQPRRVSDDQHIALPRRRSRFA